MKKIIKILILILISYFLIKHFFIDSNSNNIISNIIKNPNVIAISYNENYNGIGQEAVKNKEGYFTTFTTEEKNKKTYKEYKQNGNGSWTNNQYWGGTMSENGCRNNCNVHYIKWL